MHPVKRPSIWMEEYFDDDPPTPDYSIPGNEIFKYLFNKDTCRRVLEESMQYGYRVDGGETMGKTIILAYNHKHVQMIRLLYLYTRSMWGYWGSGSRLIP